MNLEVSKRLARSTKKAFNTSRVGLIQASKDSSLPEKCLMLACLVSKLRIAWISKSLEVATPDRSYFWRDLLSFTYESCVRWTMMSYPTSKIRQVRTGRLETRSRPLLKKQWQSYWSLYVQCADVDLGEILVMRRNLKNTLKLCMLILLLLIGRTAWLVCYFFHHHYFFC